MRADTAARVEGRESAAGDREAAALMMEAFYYFRNKP
jgi:hypothetical protein